MKWILLSLLAIAHGVLAQERLRIEVLPVYVMPTGVPETGHLESSVMEPHGLTDDAVGIVHEAMAMLGVRPNRYDVVYSDAWVRLDCTMGLDLGRGYLYDSHCNSPEYGIVLEDERDLGWVRDGLGYSVQSDGTVLLALLLKSKLFSWSGGPLGTAEYPSQRWDAGELHWSTTYCRAWSHLHVSTVAHELGHCFGLEHNGSEDRHAPNSFWIDIMAETWSPLHATYLKGPNQDRIYNHFRDLSEAEEATISSYAIPRTTITVR